MWILSLSLGFAAAVCFYFAKYFKRAKGTSVLKASALVMSLMFTGLCCYFGILASRPSTHDPTTIVSALQKVRPVAVATAEGNENEAYASSESCSSCHAEQHESWFHSYHRTMTQVASGESVIGDFDSEQVFAYGDEIRLRQDGERFIATMKNRSLPPPYSDTAMEHDIVMTTGSHHMQVYWYATGDGRRVGQLPIAWLNEWQRWVPIDSLFIRPPQTQFQTTKWRWNLTCIKCHVTQGRPRIDVNRSPQSDTQVAEFGIACEACHGPGAEHVRDHLASSSNPAKMKNPESLSHQRSAEVCGQCHSVWTSVNRGEAVLAHGEGQSYRPGQTLSDSRHVFGTGQAESDHVKEYLSADPTFHEDRFWPDGMVRVSGREYNGLVRSKCFKSGQLTCLNCHEMHPENPTKDWANDQLASIRENDACLTCHEQLAEPSQLVEHTKHQIGSSGSQCNNCHMPHTTYGLLKAIRSHEISSPSVQETIDAGRPNACNLCHVDRTLPWSAKWLTEWYGIRAPDKFTKEQRSYSAILLAALSGDAGQRALAAWTLGWQPVQKAAQTDWAAPILGQLLSDPYDAVRLVAYRSLRSYPSFADLRYDFLASPLDRQKVTKSVIEQWQKSVQSRSPNPELLIDTNGLLHIRQLNELLGQRNDRVIVLAE